MKKSNFDIDFFFCIMSIEVRDNLSIKRIKKSIVPNQIMEIN